MRIFRARMELLDYVFFATIERGKVYETGAFIHNYALVYALGLVEDSGYAYAQLAQRPRYEDELAPLNGRVYITPARPLQVSYRLTQWNTMREGYAFPGKLPSVGYPDWGFARVLRPGCIFEFYILVPERASGPQAPALTDLLGGRKVRVRLGKFLAKAGLRAEEAGSVLEARGEFDSVVYLNWRDLQTDPVACDVVAASLPTRLLAGAHFANDPFYRCRFGEDIIDLPASMAFLARGLRATAKG